ncbi:hypothetical protein [Tropicimonas sp. IMCC6043]|nr:hypothetical protein [Tropicimonas sp. IMCC6043]
MADKMDQLAWLGHFAGRCAEMTAAIQMLRDWFSFMKCRRDILNLILDTV